MKYNRCGASGLMLPAISLGLWHNFGGVDVFENSRQMICRCFDLGITHFDIANNYGPPAGSAEETFGRILKTDLAGYRDELVISSKAGYGMWPGPYGEWGSKKHVLSSLDQSLKRIGIDYVDIFYSHRFDPDTPLEETMGALAQAVHQGKALYVGISNYKPDVTEKAAAILKQLGVKCLIHQPYYNMLDRTIEKGLLDVLKKEQMGCIAFCPLSQGILTDRYLQGIPADSRAGRPTGYLRPEGVTEDKLNKVRQLQTVAEKRGQTVAQMALAWTLQRVTSALIGASKVKHIEENIAALRNLEFSKEELAAIDKIVG